MRRMVVWARSATLQKSGCELSLVSSASSVLRPGRSKKLLQLVQAFRKGRKLWGCGSGFAGHQSLDKD